MKDRLLLDIISSTVFKLLVSKSQTLLVWWDALPVLDLRFYVINYVRRFDLEGDGLSSNIKRGVRTYWVLS